MLRKDDSVTSARPAVTPAWTPDLPSGAHNRGGLCTPASYEVPIELPKMLQPKYISRLVVLFVRPALPGRCFSRSCNSVFPRANPLAMRAASDTSSTSFNHEQFLPATGSKFSTFPSIDAGRARPARDWRRPQPAGVSEVPLRQPIAEAGSGRG